MNVCLIALYWYARSAVAECGDGDTCATEVDDAALLSIKAAHTSERSAQPLSLPYKIGFAKGYVKPEKSLRTQTKNFKIHKTLTTAPLPKFLDWRQTPVVTPVLNQGQCGSCWAFSAVETIGTSYILWVSHGVQEMFSVQQVLSCATNRNFNLSGLASQLFGCEGGSNLGAFIYMILHERRVLASAGFWPYVQSLHEPCGTGQSIPSNVCTAPCDKTLKPYLEEEGDSSEAGTLVSVFNGPSAVVEEVHYATDCAYQYHYGRMEENPTDCEMDQLAHALNDHGPLSVCLDAGPFNSYGQRIKAAQSSGEVAVISFEDCGGNKYEIDHCVTLVGFNATAPTPYYIIKNSWTTAWGYYGYGYLEYGKNTCGIAASAMYPTLKGANSSAYERLHKQATTCSN